MTAIGATPPTATRAEPTDIVIGNFVENAPFTTDVTVTGLRRSNASYEIESINNDVNLKTNGIVGTKLAQNGDFSVDTNGIFYDKSTGRVGIKTGTPSHTFSVLGTLFINGVSRFSRADSTPAGTAGTIFNDAVFGSTDTVNTGVTLLGSGQLGIAFGDIADTDIGQIRYQNSSDKMEFITNTAIGLSLDSTGGLFLPLLKSGATQGAASAAANELWFTVSHATLPDNVILIGA